MDDNRNAIVLLAIPVSINMDKLALNYSDGLLTIISTFNLQHKKNQNAINCLPVAKMQRRKF